MSFYGQACCLYGGGDWVQFATKARWLPPPPFSFLGTGMLPVFIYGLTSAPPWILLKFGCQLAPPRIFLVQCIASVYFYFLCTEKRQMYWICLFPNVICIGIYSYTMLIHRVNQVSLIFLQERRVQASDFYQKKRWQERLRFRGLVFSIAIFSRHWLIERRGLWGTGSLFQKVK